MIERSRDLRGPFFGKPIRLSTPFVGPVHHVLHHISYCGPNEFQVRYAFLSSYLYHVLGTSHAALATLVLVLGTAVLAACGGDGVVQPNHLDNLDVKPSFRIT